MKSQKLDIKHKLMLPYRYLTARTEFGYLEEMSVPRRYINQYIYSMSAKAKKELEIVFLGDFMGIEEKMFSFSEDLKALFKTVDFVAINLATSIVASINKSMGQQNTLPSSFVEILKFIPKEKLIVGVANSTLMQMGPEIIKSTLDFLKSCNIKIIGTRDQKNIELAEGLVLEATSLWNQDASHEINTSVTDDKSGSQVIRYMHWGNEFDALPEDSQVELAEELSHKSLMIIGHNSHVPQPLEFINGKLAAFSLGNVLSSYRSEKVNNGICLKASLSQIGQKWFLKASEWNHLHINVGLKNLLIETIEREESVPDFGV